MGAGDLQESLAAIGHGKESVTTEQLNNNEEGAFVTPIFQKKLSYKEVKSLTQDLVGFKPKQSGSRKHTLTHYDTLPPDQGSDIFFFFFFCYKGADNKYFSLSRPYGLCHNYSSLLDSYSCPCSVKPATGNL